MIMYLIYIDESGTFDKKDKSKNFVLAGFIVNEHRWRELDDKLKQLKIQFFPSLRFLEIHTADIVHGKNKFQGVDVKLRCDFLNKISDLIKQSEIKVFCVVIKKEEVYTNNIIFNMGYELLYERIAWNIQNLNEGLQKAGEQPNNAIIFMDSREEGWILNMIRNKVRNLIFKGSKYDHNHMIIEDPILTNSAWRGNIQLADLLAFVFNHANRNQKNKHFLIAKTLENLYKIALDKMEKPNTDYPAYCYKIWPKKS